MKGFGCYGYGYGNGGGSSPSSSNLSALAPPFTVDRSAAKPYGAPLMTSNLWTPSPHVPDYFVNPNIDNVSLPPNSVSKYSSSQCADPSLNYKELNGASFGQYSGSGKNLNDEKAYYPSYVSPAIGEGSPLVSLNDSGYHWSDTSGVATLSGSMNDEYTRSLSGLEYPSQWGGFWNGMTGSESARSDGLDKSFSRASPYFNLDYLKQGVEEAKDMSVHACPSVPYGTDVHESENHLGSFCTNPSEYKFSAPDFLEFIPADSSAAHSSGAPLVTPGIHRIESLPKPGMKSWSSHIPYTPSNEESIEVHELESAMKPSPSLIIGAPAASKSPLVSPRIQPPSLVIGQPSGVEMSFSGSDKNCIEHPVLASITKPSPGIVIRSATVATDSSCILSHENYIKYFGSDLAGKIVDIAEDDLHGGKDLSIYPCFKWNKQSIDNSSFSSHLEKNDYSLGDRRSTMKEPSCSRAVNKDAYALFEPRIELQAPQVRKPNSYTSAVDDLNQHNPAEDSPCWKGATSIFSPFGNSEPVSSQHLLKKLDPCKGSGLHGLQIFPLNTNDDPTALPEKLGDSIEYKGNMPVDYALLSSTSRHSIAPYRYEEHTADPNDKAGLGSLNVICGNGDITKNFTQEPKKSDSSTSRLDTDIEYKHSKTMQQHRTPNTIEEKQAYGICAADIRMNVEDTLQDWLSGVSNDSAKKVLSLPASGEDILAGLSQPSGGVSAQELKLNMLVLTMQTLSDILLYRCSNDAFSLKSDYRNSLGQVISNLSACLEYGKQKPPTKVSFFSEPESSHFPNEDNNVSICPELVTANIQGGSGNRGLHVDMGKVMDSGNDKLQKIPSVRGDADAMAQEYMTQAIKKILSDNLHYDEEMQPEVLLYRNLWLEAEAEICSTNYKTRFDRMKILMEKCRSPETEEVSTDVEKLSRCKVTAGQLPHQSVIGTPHSPSTSTSTTSCADEVMARFHILKSRDDNSASGVGQEEQAKSAANAKDLPSFDVSVQGQVSPDSGKTSYANSVEDSVMARFNILNSRTGNFVTTTDLEDQVTCQLTPDQSYFDTWACHANDHSSPQSSVPVQGCPSSNKATQEDNNENALMDRVNILKRRDENSRCVDMQGQQMPEFCDLGFRDSRNNSPTTDGEIQNGPLKTTMAYELQHSGVNCVEGTISRMEPHICIEDHLAAQSFKKDRPGHQFSAAWYDSSSSEWEHVLKDEITCRNDATQSTV